MAKVQVLRCKLLPKPLCSFSGPWVLPGHSGLIARLLAQRDAVVERVNLRAAIRAHRLHLRLRPLPLRFVVLPDGQLRRT